MTAPLSRADLETEKNRILDTLGRFAGPFASSSALGARSSRAKAALAELVDARKVRRFGPAGRPSYRLASRCSEDELVDVVEEQLRTLHQGGAPVLIPLSRLASALRKLPVPVREYKLPALKRLAQRKEVIIFQAGRQSFLVFTASLRDYLSPKGGAASQTPPPATVTPAVRDEGLPQRIQQAYTEVMAARHAPDVPISELYARVGGSLEAFHEVLRAACYEQRAVPTVGEPAFASDTARRQALVIDEEKFLNIKFLP
ncbi:MAG: hypothetical protein JOY92_00075 [Verrucomicrobia bacterium]|nr:hypothetical protein [Verrucomicrobiota bacterium]